MHQDLCHENPGTPPGAFHLEFVESFRATEKENILSKSGFDLVPYVGDFFPSSVDVMNFYTDLPNGDYYLVVEAIDRNNELLAQHKSGFQRSNPGLTLKESDIR